MNPKTILVVDDSATMRQLLTLTLKRLKGCEVVEAAHGAEAVAKLSSRPFDLVIADLKMPEMDGLELVNHIRSVLKLSLPIVIVTTKGGEEDRDRGLKRGANAYLTKPISGTALLQLVERLLDSPCSHR
ncbi:MAG: response regulator [Candidatus Methylomirabilales bacterium]